MNFELIDTHCHLDEDYGPLSPGGDPSPLINQALKAGITHLITIGTSLDQFAQVQALSEKFAAVYHTLGIHPHSAEADEHRSWDDFTGQLTHPKCRAVGEIGLDYHYGAQTADAQKRVLKRQLDLARQHRLPVVIHSREAEEDLHDLLADYAHALLPEAIPGIIHSFSGSVAFGQKCLDLGFFISFSGILTFKKADDIRLAAQTFPLERLLVETDSPYLAPVPNRGKKCEPAWVRFTANRLAELKGLPLQQVCAVTTQNAKQIFKLR